jgi:tetratricopeptide (TPR) repeat protein
METDNYRSFVNTLQRALFPLDCVLNGALDILYMGIRLYKSLPGLLQLFTNIFISEYLAISCINVAERHSTLSQSCHDTAYWVAFVLIFLISFRIQKRIMRLGSVRNTIGDLTEVLWLNPEDADAYIQRGNKHCELEDYQCAIHDFAKALQINPRDDNASKLLSSAQTDLELIERLKASSV